MVARVMRARELLSRVQTQNTDSNVIHAASVVLRRVRHRSLVVLMTDIEIDQLRAKVQPAIAIAIPEPYALAACDVQRRRCALHRPGEHRVLAVLVDNLSG